RGSATATRPERAGSRRARSRSTARRSCGGARCPHTPGICPTWTRGWRRSHRPAAEAGAALASQPLQLPPTISDFERRAAEVLPEGPHGYFAGGAGAEITLRDNVDAWQRLALRPRVMVDCGDRDMSTTVLGRRHPHPVIVAPTAFHALATP